MRLYIITNAVKNGKTNQFNNYRCIQRNFHNGFKQIKINRT